MPRVPWKSFELDKQSLRKKRQCACPRGIRHEAGVSCGSPWEPPIGSDPSPAEIRPVVAPPIKDENLSHGYGIRLR
jgi:hypothetical protein